MRGCFVSAIAYRKRVPFRPPIVVAATLAALAAVAACSGSSSGSGTPGPMQDPTHWVVSLGDSYIAGEGDRWAGNTAANATSDFEKVDALGSFAYVGEAGLEDIRGCHRAILPEVEVDYGDVLGQNFACSGAETGTELAESVFKPGIDFYDKAGRIGQALALQRFARTHDVTTVVLSIGGNDFNFGAILTTCVENFFSTVGATPAYCSDDVELASYFTPSYVADVRKRIDGALTNIATAMEQAGSSASDYRIIVQNYPSPVPDGAGFRYPETSAGRLDLGGCPVFDRDATWANSVVLTTINDTVERAVASSGMDNITLLDLSQAFVGHRLCEQGAAQMQESGLDSWRSPGAANALEWVNQIYLKGIPWQTQESAHPNYWGTAAERNCLRQVVQSAATSSVTCVRDGTAMVGREPKMKLSG